ncbi:hypothetical protein AGLY_001617 [Aphis glycines]|uniref:Uncharacterized protein n=1 Tax=Aphis glycines TaxID=307491 RepID=A0A6G0U5P7_APHGL|nr:hypothetical protein AGLY_001617 [Aphis glycines]
MTNNTRPGKKRKAVVPGNNEMRNNLIGLGIRMCVLFPPRAYLHRYTLGQLDKLILTQLFRQGDCLCFSNCIQTFFKVSYRFYIHKVSIRLSKTPSIPNQAQINAGADNVALLTIGVKTLELIFSLSRPIINDTLTRIRDGSITSPPNYSPSSRSSDPLKTILERLVFYDYSKQKMSLLEYVKLLTYNNMPIDTELFISNILTDKSLFFLKCFMNGNHLTLFLKYASNLVFNISYLQNVIIFSYYLLTLIKIAKYLYYNIYTVSRSEVATHNSQVL